MSYAETIIFNWFCITQEQAKNEALQIEQFIVDIGGNSSDSSGIEKAVIRSIAPRFPWKNLKKKSEIEANRTLTEQAYNSYIRRKNLSSPQRF
jgi:hypothetical protein